MPALRHTFIAALLCSAVATPIAALAQPNGRGAPPAPPPEAFTACQGKAEGTAVTMTMPDGKTLTGTCRSTATGSGTTLAARPDGQPGHRPPPPPSN
ncbi:MAG: hypothetical protein QM569_05565 [Acidovorax sp.]|uniref:hypothetical protein n=1 Tax=Acidovorax sp. TaxID=1872122 RepID=UPI0039E2AD5F